MKKDIKKEYDFSKGVKNPYAKKLREQKVIITNGKAVEVLDDKIVNKSNSN